MTTRTCTAADALVDVLYREGVRVIFGIPGAPTLPLFDSLIDRPEIQVILTKHEEAAAYAAYAYARVTGKLGVCTATLGPGATNLIAGFPISMVGGVPVLAITGQVQTNAVGKGAHQESTGWNHSPNQEAMSAATTKLTATCVDAKRFPDQLRSAIRIAYAGRPGPTHVIVPANLLNQTIEYEELEPAAYRCMETAVCDDRAIALIAQAIAQAEYPLILMGERAVTPSAGRAAAALSENFGIPIAADLSCKSVVDEGLPNYLGCMGVMGHRPFERYLHEKCDLVLAVGQTFNEVSTLSWDPALSTGRRLIQIDVDGEEIGKAFPVSLAAVGNIPTSLERLGRYLELNSMRPSAERLQVVASLRKVNPLFDAEEMHSDKVPLLPQRVVHELRQGLSDDAIVLSDSSKWTRWLGRFYQSKQDGVVTAHDYEPMGWAVAGVLGVKSAFPDRHVVCVSGDGAFLMSGMELSAAVNHDLHVTWVVMNDSRLGVIYDMQNILYGGRLKSTKFVNPDFVKFAQAFGMHGEVIETPGALAEALRQSKDRQGSTLLDVRFDPDEIPPIRPRAALITSEMGLPPPKPGPEATRVMIKILKEK